MNWALEQYALRTEKDFRFSDKLPAMNSLSCTFARKEHCNRVIPTPSSSKTSSVVDGWQAGKWRTLRT